MSTWTAPSWVTAFVDLPAEHHAAGTAFWQAVTGHGLSASRGEHEFATLLPSGGDAHLRVQRVAAGQGGIHLDLHRPGRPFAVRTSPGGLAWCEVPGGAGEPAPPASWAGGHRSVVDQVCVDAPAAHFEAEVAFWAEQTGWELRASSVSASFRALVRPEGQPVRILLQQVDDDRPHTTAHLDLATDDRAAETRRHVALGARVLAEREVWTVLRAPTGGTYCLTDRDPATGVLG